MRAHWRIGSLFGIPLYLDSSWFLVLAFVTLLNATDERIQLLAGDIPSLAWAIGLLMALLLFLSVLLHELGHSLVARSQGIAVNSITLFLFGGLAEIDRESPTPKDALWVAIAGPMVSFILFGVFLLVGQIPEIPLIIGYSFDHLAKINLFLALFNLIPGLPLDGGQILKALIWKVTGDRLMGVRWAVASGQVIGWIGMVFGLVFVLLTGDVGGAWLGLVGWFVLRNATAYDRLTTLQESLLTMTAGEVMTHEYRVLNAHQTLEAFAGEYILGKDSPSIVYFASAEGRYRGLVRVTDLQAIERSLWPEKQLLDIAHPLTEIPSVTEKTALVDVVRKLARNEEQKVTVLTPSGAVAGVIDRGDLVKAIATKHKLPIQETEIQRVKLEGIYPSYLPLDEIATALEKNDPTTAKIGEPSLSA